MDNQNKSLTIEDLARYTEEVLLPAMGDMMDQKLELNLAPIKKDIVEIKQDIVEMKQNIVEMKQELSAIRHELDAINRRLDKLDQRTKEDSDAYGSDILDLRTRVKRLEMEVTALESKQK